MEGSICDTLIGCLRGVAEDFYATPGDYLYEADLQAAVVSQLRKEPAIRPPAEPCFPLRNVRPSYTEASVKLGRVHAEYPSGQRFDVAILGRSVDVSRRLWNQRPILACEIKLWQWDGTGGGFRKDLAKLWRYREELRAAGAPAEFSGVAALFVHPGYPFERHLRDVERQLVEYSGQDFGGPIQLHLFSTAIGRAGFRHQWMRWDVTP